MTQRGCLVEELMNAVDESIPTVRTNKPFLMPVEDVFTITGQWSWSMTWSAA